MTSVDPRNLPEAALPLTQNWGLSSQHMKFGWHMQVICLPYLIWGCCCFSLDSWEVSNWWEMIFTSSGCHSLTLASLTLSSYLCLLVISCLFHCIYTCGNYSTKRCPFSSVCLFIGLFLLLWTHSYWIVFCSHDWLLLIIFGCLFCYFVTPALTVKSSSCWLLYPEAMASSLCTRQSYMFQAYFMFSLPSPGIRHFPKEALLHLGAGNAGVSWFLGPLSRQV